ncbi:MAG: hypothetical protein A2Y02_02505 [Omnitrophica bacterium GWA2_52_12]|nr:MAG: hypothetical protein A2Y02_02505 [Omnitrophica bacterium GWA2_52_12]
MRLKNYDYSSAGFYFVTLCAHNRERLFGEIRGDAMFHNENGKIVETTWHDLIKHVNGIALDSFVIMPNHIHGIIVIAGSEKTVEEPSVFVGAIPTTAGRHELPLRSERRKMLLPKLVGRLKMVTAKRINELRGTPGAPVWQRNYYEHVIRDEKSLSEMREYIANNPKQWDLDENNPKNLKM